MVRGLLIFALWGAGIITEAGVTSAGPRVGQWFDPLQIDVLTVTALSTAAGPAGTPGTKDAPSQPLLFLGSDDSNYVFYDQAARTVWLVPERSSSLDVR